MSDEMSKSMNQMANTAKRGMNKVYNSVKSGTTKVNRTTKSGLLKTIQAYVTSFSGMHTAVKNGMSRNVSTVRSNNNRIVSNTRSLTPKLRSVGLFAMAGLRNGLNAGAPGVYNTAFRIANNVAMIMRRALDVRSPSRITTKIGIHVAEGLAVGMNKTGRLVEKASEFLANKAIPEIKTSSLSKQVMNATKQLTDPSYIELGDGAISGRKPIYVQSVVEVDSRELARSTYVDITELQERANNRKRRWSR